MRVPENRQFHLHLRNRVFYVQFVDPVTKRRHSALSTGKTNRDDALLVAYEWQKNGIPQKQSREETVSFARPLSLELSVDQLFAELKKAELGTQDVLRLEKILKDKGLIDLIIKRKAPEAELLVEYLRRFWTYDTSPYIAEKKAHKINMGKHHALTSFLRVNIYWAPYFENRLLGEVTRQDIKQFSVDIAEKHPTLSPLTLKAIIRVGVTALRWAFANGLISNDPTIDLPSYSSKGKKRGVLTPEEAKALFALPWHNERYKLVNMIAMTTGLRCGEILAIKVDNIGEDYLTIKRSYSRVDGLKSTKTGEERIVPILPQIRDAMRRWGEMNPHGDGFIFFGKKPNQPFDQHETLKALNKALIQLRVGDRADEKEIDAAKVYWKTRNIVFHSWRHFYAARISDRVEVRKVMLATGHKTKAVFDEYAGHGLQDDLSDVARATETVFGGLLPEELG